MTTSLQDIEALRRAAVDMITEAWHALAVKHVVPCSKYHPYVQVGRDYEGSALAGGRAFAQFAAALLERYPAWFQAPQDQFPRWYPDNCAFHFVDACIAELTLRGETGDMPSEAVEAMLLELVDYLDSEHSRLACARRVSHLMTSNREELTLAGVTILAYAGFQEARQIIECIPTARSAFNGERPRSFAPPEATLVSYATGPDPFVLPPEAERRIGRLLLALRLLFGATTANIYQVTGEPTSVCRYTAHLDEMTHEEWPMAIRPAVVSQATVEPVEKLLALYDSTEHRTGKELVHGLEMAVLKFTDSFTPKPWFEKIVDLATALEATLSGKDKTDVTLRICTRTAHILTTDTDPPTRIYGDVKALYDMRSSLVHGSVIMQRELEKWLAAVSSVSAGRSPRMRIELAVDRLRDLVRRSILMRLLLNRDGRWPLRGDPPAIDQLFTDPRTAEEWRNAWHQSATDLGASDAAQPASPLCDSVQDEYPGKHG